MSFPSIQNLMRIKEIKVCQDGFQKLLTKQINQRHMEVHI